MKRYRFRLESVRRVRIAQEREARAQLAAANREVQRNVEEVARRAARYAQLSAPAGATISSYLSSRATLVRVAESIRYARQRQRDAELVAEHARAAWGDAARRVKSLDRLDDRRREEHAREQGRREEQVVDDVVTGRHRRAGGSEAVAS